MTTYVAYFHVTEDGLEHTLTDLGLAEFLATCPFARVLNWFELTASEEADFQKLKPEVGWLKRPA